MNKDKLIKILSKYFDIGDTYTYELTRDKKAFEYGTVDLTDFVEWDEEKIYDLANYILENYMRWSNG